MTNDNRTPVQQVIDAIREKIADAYETQDLDGAAVKAFNAILDEVEEEGWR